MSSKHQYEVRSFPKQDGSSPNTRYMAYNMTPENSEMLKREEELMWHEHAQAMLFASDDLTPNDKPNID